MTKVRLLFDSGRFKGLISVYDERLDYPNKLTSEEIRDIEFYTMAGVKAVLNRRENQEVK